MYPTFTKRLVLVLALILVLAGSLLNTAPAYAQDGGRTEYTVRSGDTLKKIADRFGLTVQSILDINKNIDDPNIIFPGQVIVLPTGRSEGITAAKAARMFVWQREKDGGRVEKDEHLYLVRSGDNLTNIASRYGLTLEALLEANPGITDPNQLFRGELVRIPDYGRSETAPAFYSTPEDRTSSK